jgi:2-amino-4-hydroxy-6-hydroxymethyldihydropteridine diphosphokinase
MNRVFLTIGSNIDREHNLPAAVQLLKERVPVVAVSSVYESTATGLKNQPNFFNAAALIETALSPEAIKDQLIAEIEAALKRERQEDRNAPRTIDIDIALFNDEVLAYVPADGRPRHLPDPDLLQMTYAIVPLAELAPDLIHPETGERLDAIRERLIEASGEKDIWRREDISLGL